MSRPYGFIALVLLLIALIPACSTPFRRIQSDVVPAGSLRVAQVIDVGKRADILKNAELYKDMIDAGVPDSDLIDGSVVAVRIYCCGGPSKELSAEYVEVRLLHVPKDIRATLGDFVEVKVGRSPVRGDGGRLNTVTRVVAKQGDEQETCWWDPKDPKLWLRVPYCEWMQREGWIKQGGTAPAWYMPAP